MPVKSDRWIIEMAKNHQMIAPFAESQVRTGISFGVSSYGYDFSLADEFKMFDPEATQIIDPKISGSAAFVDIKAASVVLPPNSFMLGLSREYFKIQRNVIPVCFGKSTYARSGVIVNVTPFEPEWEGYATVSMANSSPRPVRVYANEGIAQILFIEADELCHTSYGYKKGKYQGQIGVTPPKL